MKAHDDELRKLAIWKRAITKDVDELKKAVRDLDAEVRRQAAVQLDQAKVQLGQAQAIAKLQEAQRRQE